MIDNWTPEEREAALEEYKRRLVPASDEEIIALAETLWANPALRAVFQRVGFDGDFTDTEEAAVDAAIDAYRQGPLWDRDELHLALAPCLARQRAAGMIDRFDSPQARAFLADRRVTRGGILIKAEKTTAADAMAFAKVMRADPRCWAVITRLNDHPDMFVYEGDPEGVLDRFEDRYRAKYGLFNRSRFGTAVGMLRGVASGLIPSLDSPEAWAVIRSSDLVID